LSAVTYESTATGRKDGRIILAQEFLATSKRAGSRRVTRRKLQMKATILLHKRSHSAAVNGNVRPPAYNKKLLTKGKEIDRLNRYQFVFPFSRLHI
jgi:hypothetical protein